MKMVNLWRRRVAVMGCLVLLTFQGFSQCAITSSNGWTANISITPIKVIPEFVSCPWYYHYEIQYSMRVDFYGSTNNRSLSCNVYFNCTGGSGGLPYNPGGTYTNSTTVTLQTNNQARQYNAVTANNYGVNPSCSIVNLQNVNCSTFRIDYWGSGVTNGSITCNVGVPLPITLLHFSATPEQDGARLDWVTASEVNNDYFRIERSVDGKTFEEIAQVKGAGNSTHQLSYSVMDKDSPAMVAYYRLKQTDFNGQFSYSSTVAVRMNKKDFQFVVLSNPVRTRLELNYIGSTAFNGEYSIYDDKGKFVMSQQVKAIRGTNLWDADLSSIGSGIYIIVFEDESGYVHKVKLVKI